jgi:hypothetical protein
MLSPNVIAECVNNLPVLHFAVNLLNTEPVKNALLKTATETITRAGLTEAGKLVKTIGSVPLADGEFTFLVQSKNDQVTIEVINDTFLPCHLLSVEWEALYNRRSQKV